MSNEYDYSGLYNHTDGNTPPQNPQQPQQPAPQQPETETRASTFCSNCGAKSNGEKFCQNCGAPLR